MKTILFLFSLLFCFSLNLLAQSAPPGLPSDPAQAPIDGGLSVLALAGGAYAVKKLRKSRSV